MQCYTECNTRLYSDQCVYCKNSNADLAIATVHGGTGLVSNEKGNKKRQRGRGQAKGIAKFFSSKSSKKWMI